MTGGVGAGCAVSVPPSTQAWLARSAHHDGPCARLFESVSGRAYRKPAGGGLWTSTWDPMPCSGWAQWCIVDAYKRPPFHVWLLDVDPGARIYTVDSYADLAGLVASYGDPESRYTDLSWGLIARDYDGLHLTDAGQWATRLSHPHDLYTWDCESTLWFRWVFTDVRRHGPWVPPSRPCDDTDCYRCDGSGTHWLAADEMAEAAS
ncbi:MAG TPA: hypothetical protein VFI46_08085 [Jiangellaceae bacterium]|nr:hypothetical protein [Jiangellaceae bacterium]